MTSSKPEDRFHVITGGPGSGKSTLIDALSIAHHVVGEAGRAIIREQMAKGGNALPWGDRISYSRLMLKRDIAAYEG